MLQSEKLRQDWQQATVKATEFSGKIQENRAELARINSLIPQQPELMMDAARLTSELEIMHRVYHQLVDNRDSILAHMGRVRGWENSPSGRRNLAMRHNTLTDAVP
jgi:hypothetical protein